MVVKLIEIKNRSYHFWNDIIFFENFDPNLDKKESQADVGIDMFFIRYIVKKPEYKIDSVNPLYLVIKSLEEYVEKINGTNYRNLVIMSNSDKSRLNILWKDIEDKINDLLKKDYDKIKFGPEIKNV